MPDLPSGVEAYNGHLVIVELLMCRAMSALSLGMQAVNMRMTAADEAHLFRRPRFAYDQHGTVEHIRWYDANGFSRSTPLSREALVASLTRNRHLSHGDAAILVASQSHAIDEHDQLWLESRARTSVLKRPLLATEYDLLAREIETIYHLSCMNLAFSSDNAQIAIECAGNLGWFHTDYQRTPFRTRTLSSVFKIEHHECMNRRSREAHVHEMRVKGLARADALRMQAITARYRADHSAFLASRSLKAIAA